MLDALTKLGVAVTQTGNNDYSISGSQGIFPVTEADFFFGMPVPLSGLWLRYCL